MAKMDESCSETRRSFTRLQVWFWRFHGEANHRCGTFFQRRRKNGKKFSTSPSLETRSQPSLLSCVQCRSPLGQHTFNSFLLCVGVLYCTVLYYYWYLYLYLFHIFPSFFFRDKNGRGKKEIEPFTPLQFHVWESTKTLQILKWQLQLRYPLKITPKSKPYPRHTPLPPQN